MRDRRGERRRTERRSKWCFTHVPERRTGFDRRRTYPLTEWLRENPLSLVFMLFTINTLSGLDFIFTYTQLVSGIASEANPVLAELYAQGPLKAWLFKTVVMGLVSLGIWHQRRQRAILAVAVLALFIYLAVVAYHVIGMTAVTKL